MPSYYWLKLWIDILDDWKVAPLPDRLWRRFVECCLVAKKVDDGGYLPAIEKLAFILRSEPVTLQTDLAALERETSTGDQPGIVQCIEGRWFVTNLEKRQANMSATERKRKQRERDRGQSRASHADVTKGDVEDRGTEDQTTEDQRSDDQTTDSIPRDAKEPAVADVLEAVRNLGITDPKATSLYGDYSERGDLDLLVPRLEGWIAHCANSKKDQFANPIGFAIMQTENGDDPPTPPPDEWADIIEH